MFFNFNLATKKNLAHELKREWIEKDHAGNYSASTILGQNTRKEHGLFVVNDKKKDEYFLLLSHVQDELINNDQKYKFFSAAYESGQFNEGRMSLTSFKLAPFPTFTYEGLNFRVEKNIFLIKEHERLIIRYKISGELEKDAKMVIRPFLAYRNTKNLGKQTTFYTEDVFEMENQFRFLPNPDSPELYAGYTDGEFISAPIWYYKFFYQEECGEQNEDLLNPGFFEIPVKDGQEIFLTFGLSEIETGKISELYQQELQHRENFNQTLEKDTRIFQHIVERVSNFEYHYTNNSHFLLNSLLKKEIHLTPFAFAAHRILRCGVEQLLALKYFSSLYQLEESDLLQTVLTGEHPELKADLFTAPVLIFFLYEFHNNYAAGSMVEKSLKMMASILGFISKNKIPLYRTDYSKYLNVDITVNRANFPSKESGLYPKDPEFLLNVLWYNALKMYCQLCSLSNVRSGKYEKISQKVHQNLLEQYSSTIENCDLSNPDTYIKEFHPTYIYALSLPFQIFNQVQSKKLLKILLQNYLSDEGVLYPQLEGEPQVSVLMLSDFFEAWHYAFADDILPAEFFNDISKQLNLQFRENMLGYLPLFFSDDECTAFDDGANLMATTEILHFYKRLHQLKTE